MGLKERLIWVYVCFIKQTINITPSSTDTLSVCSNDSIMPGSSATLQPGHVMSSHTSPGPKRPGM